MRACQHLLLNTAEIEIWPAALLRARSSAQARIVARARWVLRRKCDGRDLVAESACGMLPLAPRWEQAAGMAVALEVLAATRVSGLARSVPLTGLRPQLARLGLDATAYGARTGLRLQPEPTCLALAGFDRYQRPLWLRASAGRAWRWMQAAALAEGVRLDAISGYRSHAYQLGIFQRKLQRGTGLEQILSVNAAPGFSEHHSGAALDIGTPGEPPVEESFDRTSAFAWLSAYAGRFGFRLSYPRDNPHGIVYEPWHWRYHGK